MQVQEDKVDLEKLLLDEAAARGECDCVYFHELLGLCNITKDNLQVLCLQKYRMTNMLGTCKKQEKFESKIRSLIMSELNFKVSKEFNHM